jgi:acyl-CoA oxidase
MRRLRRLSLHLLHPPAAGAGAAPPASSGDQQLALAACAGGRARRVEGGADVAAALAAYLRGRNRATQMRLFDFFRARPDLQTPVELTTAAHRELCYRQLRALVREAGVRPLTLMANDPAEYFAVMEAAGGADISLGVKLGVQYRLVGGSVLGSRSRARLVILSS